MMLCYFYSPFHEYGHIIYGDCDEAHEVDLDREKKATELLIYSFQEFLLFNTGSSAAVK